MTCKCDRKQGCADVIAMYVMAGVVAWVFARVVINEFRVIPKLQARIERLEHPNYVELPAEVPR